MDILDKAPTGNIDAERQVGRVNYELSIRGTKNLKAASASSVKSVSSDLLRDQDPSTMSKFRKISGKVKEFVDKWNKQQNDVLKGKMSAKEIENLKIDQRRNNDLIVLKAVGGPFTKSADVKAYMQDGNITDSEKNKRLYTEIRYNRDTTVSMPKCSDIFKLKFNYKNLTSDKYASNLCIYLDKIKCTASATLGDFQKALEDLSGQ